MSAQRFGPSTTFTAGEFETWARTKPEPSQRDRQLAARAIAAYSEHAAECRDLLDMLELDAQEGKHDAQRPHPPVHRPLWPTRRGIPAVPLVRS